MWMQEVMRSLDRKKAEITFDPHLFDRKRCRNLELDKVEETVRKGRLLPNKCESPNKICFILYYGKENKSYIVIVRYHLYFIEVKTAWKRKGR